MLQELGNAFAFVLLAALLPPIILVLGSFFRPSFPHEGKLTTYECGEMPVGSAYLMFNNRFYLVAIVFLVFDVEVALLFPILMLFREAIEIGGSTALQVFSLAFAFLGVLFVGLIYEWKTGDIDWVKDAVDRKDAMLGGGPIAKVEAKSGENIA
ncbi:NADH-quinone oxidoreductase subunit A [bacterium]|nr:NADH-quinone oxidoreductase subunit A [bacterium]